MSVRTRLARILTVYRGAFLAAFLAGLACYGIDLFNLSVSLDEEAQSTIRGAVIQWVHQDRWAMYLLNAYLLPTPVVPYVSVLLGILGMAVSAVLAVDLWGGGRGARSWVATSVIVSTPVIAFLMHFNTTQYGAFLGLAAGFAGVRCFTAGGWPSMAAGWLLVVFALSVYQSIGLAIVCVYLFHAINAQLQHPARESSLFSVLLRPIGFGAWLASAAAGHKMTAVLARRWFAADGGYAIVDQAYSGLYWKWYSVDRVVEYVTGFLNGERWYLGRPAAAVLCGGCFLVLTRLVYRERATPGLLVGIGLLAFGVVSPFLLVIVTGGTFWPTRTLLGLPVLFGGVVYTALGTRSAVARSVFWVIALVCLVFFVISNNRLLYADQQQWVLDRQRVFEIQHHLEAAGLDRQCVMRLAIVGAAPFDPSAGRSEEETIGMSFFSPVIPVDRANTRIARIMQMFGMSKVYGAGTPEKYRQAVEAAADLPSWPDPASVAIFDDLAVVKLSEPTRAQLQFAGMGSK